MGEIITENTIVTIFEVIMDYVYIWGLKVPIVDALGEIAKKEKEDGNTATYHVCVGDTGLGRICSIVMDRIRFDEDMCLPDVETVADLLTQKGKFEFKLVEENHSLKKGMIDSGLCEEKVNRMLKK